MMLPLDILAAYAEINLPTALDSQIVIRNIYFDSRKIFSKEPSIFVDLSSVEDDSRKNQIDAINKGVPVILARKKLVLDSEAIFLITKNPLLSLQKMAIAHRKTFFIPIIGITGSNGKTIIKDWVSTIISPFSLTKSPASYNSQIGVPISVLQLKKGDHFGVFEAGISQVGEMTKLALIIDCTFGVFSNLADAHESGFDSSDQKLAEKLLLFKKAKQLVFRKSNELSKDIISQHIKAELISWSTEAGEDFFVKIKKSKKHARIRITGKKDLAFDFPYQDRPSIENIVTAVITALEIGIQEDHILQRIQYIEPVSMRMQLKEGRFGSLVLDDSYNADMASFQAALELASEQKGDRSLHIIVSDFDGLKADYIHSFEKLILAFQVEKISYLSDQIPSIDHGNIALQHFRDIGQMLRYFNDFPATKEMILLKGARRFGLDVLIDSLTRQVHQTELHIHLDNIAYNVKQFKKILEPDVKIMAVVKASAYGSGSLTISKFLSQLEIDYLAVAYIDEGVELREAGISLPIMVMNPDLASYHIMAQFELEPEIYSLDMLNTWIEYASLASAIHLKFDTGMHRLGIQLDELPEVINLVREHEIVVKSVFSHLHSSEVQASDAATDKQILLFNKILKEFEDSVPKNGFLKHLANTTAISRFPQTHYDMVRLGIGLYGISGDPSFQSQLRDVHSLHSYISQIKYIDEGQSIGYNQKFTTIHKTKIAIVNIGYADGISRSLSEGNFYLYHDGKALKTLGLISMDSCVVDISEHPTIQVGDVIDVINFSDRNLDQLAIASGMIPYELICRIGPRVKRVFIKE